MRHFIASRFVCTASTYERISAMYMDENLQTNHRHEVQQEFQWKYMSQGSRMHGG